LDEGDNDQAVLVHYLVAAFRAAGAEIGDSTLGLLRTPTQLSLTVLISSLINELAGLPEPYIFVLDDYHVLRGVPIHQAMGFLIEHLPSQLHIVISTREDPPLALGRLRAQRQLNELRAVDLRFTLEESAGFLNETMALGLSNEDVGSLEMRTEGWVAGLQLAGLAIEAASRQQQAGQDLVARFTASHRFVVDYLLEEVISRQSARLQTFLLRSSILDRLSGPLCAYVTGDPGAAALLTEIERANLFLVPLDDERRWHRYHHLFADLLRARLQQTEPELIPQLHRRAAEWYRQEGLLSEAIQHAIAGSDFEQAAGSIEEVAEEVWARGEWVTLGRWLSAMPDGVLRRYPRLIATQAWCSFLVHPDNPEEAETLLDDAEMVLARQAETEAAPETMMQQAQLRGMIPAIRSSIASVRGDLPRTIALSREALAHLPVSSIVVRAVPSVNLGIAYAAMGEASQAGDVLVEAVRLSREARSLVTFLVATRLLASVRTVQARLHEAADLYLQVIDVSSEPTSPLARFAGSAHLGLGSLLYEWNQPEAAVRHLVQVLDRPVETEEQSRLVLGACLTMARVHEMRGDAAAVRDLYGRVEAIGIVRDLPRALVAVCMAGLALAAGEIDKAGVWLRQNDVNPESEHLLIFERELMQLTTCRVLIAGGEASEAHSLLQHLSEAAGAAGHIDTLIRSQVLRAIALQRFDREEALVATERALGLAEPGGYMRVFLDEGTRMRDLLRELVLRGAASSYARARSLLEAFGMASGATWSLQHPQSVAEALGEREIEVLRLVDRGLSNREIAGKLVLAPSTVKWHIHNIYGKLGVTSRTQALARARELQLL
jgi:LuxR family maltose regulon positive regulatory protein